MNSIPFGVYRHYKGNLYEVTGFAKHSETLEDMVVYKALYGEGGTWVRPLSMWDNDIEIDGKTVKRFAYVGDSEASDRQHELREALRAIESTIGKCEKVELKLKDGSPQKTLTVRRIQAFRIAAELIEKELKPTDGENISLTKTYEYEAVIRPADKGGAYVVFPYDIRREFGKGRVKVFATFDGEPYTGSIVNMGVKNDDGSICYIIGVRKDIRAKIGKNPGDTVYLTIREATS